MMENGNRNIILIGYRGTGKTSVGQELARRLKRPFLDTDALIEEREGRTIRAMVDKEGWAFFREREKAAMNSLKAIRSCIIATGGGAVLDPDNARLLKSLGLVVLLTATEEVTIQRMLADPASRERRPSLLGKDSPDSSNEALLKETREILKQRMPIYRSLADVVLDTSQESPAEIADQILRHFCSNQAQSNVGTSV